MPTKFTEYTKAEWLAKVKKDLKGKPLDSLAWEANGNTYNPFFHPSDVTTPPTAITRVQEHVGVGLRINAENPKLANQIALNALNQGANELCFFYDWDNSELAGLEREAFEHVLLDGIFLDMVRIHFHSYSESGDRIRTHGSKVYQADVMQNKPLVNMPHAMSNAMKQMAHFIDSDLHEKPFRVNFWVDTTNDYFYTIAAFRAIRLCWQRIAEILPGFSPACEIIARVPIRHGVDLNTAKIHSTAQATAAILGGADALFLDPFDETPAQPFPQGTLPANTEDNFGRRIALNIQHILQLEAHLDRVQDPAAGSYFIETLTDDLALQLWTILQRFLTNLSPRSRLFKLLQENDPRLFSTTSN